MAVDQAEIAVQEALRNEEELHERTNLKVDAIMSTVMLDNNIISISRYSLRVNGRPTDGLTRLPLYR